MRYTTPMRRGGPALEDALSQVPGLLFIEGHRGQGHRSKGIGVKGIGVQGHRAGSLQGLLPGAPTDPDVWNKKLISSHLLDPPPKCL